MSWINDFLNITATALQREDLRQRLIYASSATDLPYWPGIAYTRHPWFSQLTKRVFGCERTARR